MNTGPRTAFEDQLVDLEQLSKQQSDASRIVSVVCYRPIEEVEIFKLTAGIVTKAAGVLQRARWCCSVVELLPVAG